MVKVLKKNGDVLDSNCGPGYDATIGILRATSVLLPREFDFIYKLGERLKIDYSVILSYN